MRCTYVHQARMGLPAQRCPISAAQDDLCEIHVDAQDQTDDDIADDEALERFWVCLGCDSVFEQADSALLPGQHKRWCSGIELEEGGRGD